jgi:DHA1 family tetracycline resistance protein-like MFS transporter
VFGFSNVLWLLFLARALTGVFSSTYSIAQAYVAEATSSDTRLKHLGFLARAYGMGYLFGPIIGGFMGSSLGYAAPAFLACFLALMNSLITYLKFPRESLTSGTIQPGDQRRNPIVWGSPIKHAKPERGLLLSVNFVSTFVFVCLLVTVPPWLHEIFQFGSLETGLILSYAGAISIATVVLIVPLLSRRASSTTITVMGFALISTGYLGLSLIGNSSPITLALTLILAGLLSFGFSVVGPAISSLISITGSSTQQGQVFGFAKSSASAAQVLAPAFATILFSFGVSIGIPGYAFMSCMIVGLTALPLLLLMRRPRNLGTWETILASRKLSPSLRTARCAIVEPIASPVTARRS